MELFCIVVAIFYIFFLIQKAQQTNPDLKSHYSFNYEQLIQQIESQLFPETKNNKAHIVTDEMREKAIKSASIIQAKFGNKLDFSLRSIQDIEDFCEQAFQELNNRISNSEETTNAFKATTTAWGNYFGEVLRRNYQGQWIGQVGEGNIVTPLVVIDEYKIDPYAPIHNRISKGSEFNILKHFRIAQGSFCKSGQSGALRLT